MFNGLISNVRMANPWDIVDILLVAFLFYKLMRFMRNTITDTGDGDAVEDGEFTRVLPTINPDTISRFASKLN